MRYSIRSWQRVSGLPVAGSFGGGWVRIESGEWELVKFRIKSFLKPEDDTLIGAFEKLRAIGGSDWDKVNEAKIDDHVWTMEEVVMMADTNS